jgi:hypothetical protein
MTDDVSNLMSRDASLQDGDLLPQQYVFDGDARSARSDRFDQGEEMDEEVHGLEDWEELALTQPIPIV